MKSSCPNASSVRNADRVGPVPPAHHLHKRLDCWEFECLQCIVVLKSFGEAAELAPILQVAAQKDRVESPMGQRRKVRELRHRVLEKGDLVLLSLERILTVVGSLESGVLL